MGFSAQRWESISYKTSSWCYPHRYDRHQKRCVEGGTAALLYSEWVTFVRKQSLNSLVRYLFTSTSLHSHSFTSFIQMKAGEKKHLARIRQIPVGAPFAYKVKPTFIMSRSRLYPYQGLARRNTLCVSRGTSSPSSK